MSINRNSLSHEQKHIYATMEDRLYKDKDTNKDTKGADYVNYKRTRCKENIYDA